MRKIILMLVISLIAISLNAQTFQRMAIPKGVYKLAPKGSSNSIKDVAAYCVDFSRQAPTKGISYDNVLDGSASVVFEGTNQIISLTEALATGKISIEGTKWSSVDAFLKSMDVNTRKVLSEGIEIKKARFLNEIRQTPEYLSLLPSERSRVEKELAKELAKEFSIKSFLEKNPELWMESGNWSQLRLINHTNSNISIRADKNMQVGTKSETLARKGLENFDFKSGSYGEITLQEKAWIQQTKDDYNRLKKIGEYEDELPSNEEILNKSKLTFKEFQEKHNLEITGEFDIATDQKIIEIEKKIMEDFIMLDENPNRLTELVDVIGDYQTRNSINVDNNFNSETFQKITTQKNKLSEQLQSTIYGTDEKSLMEKIDIYKRIKGLNKSEIVADQEFKNALNSDINIYVPIDGNFKHFEKSNIGIKNVEGVEIKNLNTVRYDSKSNVHLIMDKDLPNAIQSLDERLNWNYDIDELVIFPITKNTDTRDLLKEGYGKNWIKSNLKSEKEVAKKLRRSKRRTVLVVGHIEKGYFVEGNYKISIEQLNKYAKEFNLNIFHLGCSSAIDGVGTTASINTYKTVDALISSIRENHNFKDFFLSFSTKGIGPNNRPVDLLVDANTFSNKGYVQFKAYKQGAENAIATAGGSILLYSLFSEDQNK